MTEEELRKWFVEYGYEENLDGKLYKEDFRIVFNQRSFTLQRKFHSKWLRLQKFQLNNVEIKLDRSIGRIK